MVEFILQKSSRKARYIHMLDALKFIPYGVAVDEFQHFVYENPTVLQKIEEKNGKN